MDSRLLLPVIAATIALVPACTSLPPDAPSVIAEAVGQAVGKAIEQIPPPKRASKPFWVDPPTVTFGIVAVRTSHARTVVVTNPMDRPITVTAVEVSGEYFAVVEAPPLPDIIPPGGTLQAIVRFAPDAGCMCKGALTIRTKEAGPQRVEMSGRAER